MRRIFLTSTIQQPFILDDATTLRRRFALRFFVGSGPFAALRMFLNAARADCSVCWFASVYSVAVTSGARLFGKRSIIVVGGVDAVADANLEYGIWLSRWKSVLLRRALRRADCILPVDESLKTALQRLSGLPLDNAFVLPTGYDAEFWKPLESAVEPGVQQRKGVLYVATCNTTRRAQVKGLDLLLEVASALPNVPFTVIGIDPRFQQTLPFSVSSNVTLLPPVSREELLQHYRSALLYCQPSRHEGLPNALCEAMLCGAVPVGTQVGGVPTAIGDCGIIVEPNNVGALCDGIVQGLALPKKTGQRARERIAHLFPKRRREQGLIAAVEGRAMPKGEWDA